MCSRLNKLLQPSQLREFVDRHPEFQWQQKEPNGMIVTWADAAATAASAPGSASAAAPPSDAVPSDSHPAQGEVDYGFGKCDAMVRMCEPDVS